MHTLLSPANHKVGPAAPARLSPYATSLLVRERAVLLEWVSSAGRGIRRRGSLHAGTRSGGTLTVDLTATEPAERPTPGSAVTLVVPAQNTLWRFTTVTAAGMEDTTAVQLLWPVEVSQEAGRRFGRAHCMLPLSVAAGEGEGGEGRALCTYTLDVSMGGVQIATPTKLSIGAPLRLSIRLPQETVAAAATVAWSRALRDEPGDPMYTAGLRFVSLAPRAASRLRTLLGMSGLAAS